MSWICHCYNVSDEVCKWCYIAFLGKYDETVCKLKYFHVTLIKLSGLSWEFKYLGWSNFNFNKKNNWCVKCTFSLLVRWLNISKHFILWILSLFMKETVVRVDVSLDTSSQCFWTLHTILNNVLSSPEYAEFEMWNCYDWTGWSNQDFCFPITLL